MIKIILITCLLISQIIHSEKYEFYDEKFLYERFICPSDNFKLNKIKNHERFAIDNCKCSELFYCKLCSTTYRICTDSTNYGTITRVNEMKKEK
jgi:hypothetical protein